MPKTEAQKRAKRKYDGINFVRLSLDIREDEKNFIKKHAGARGMTDFILRAVHEKVERDMRKGVADGQEDT